MWCRSKLGIQRSFEGEQAVRFIPGEELSYINLIDIALKQCIDYMRRTVHPHYDFPENTPTPREKKWNPFLKLGSPQAAQLKMWFKKTVQRKRKYLCGDLKLHNNRPPALECISQTTGPRWHWINDVVNLLHFKQFSLPYTPFEACGAVFYREFKDTFEES